MSGQLYRNPLLISIWTGEEHTLRAMIVRESSRAPLAPDLHLNPVKELGQPRTPLVYIKYLRRVSLVLFLSFPSLHQSRPVSLCQSFLSSAS